MTRVRLAAFAGIGILAALQWATLLADPPTARLLGVVAVATLLGLALERLRGMAPARRRLAAAGLVLTATAAALLVLGFPARTLVPWGWDRLAAGIDLGLTGLGGKFDYPFAGEGEWARLLLVVAIVPLTIAAALLAFRPGRDPARVPVAGLVFAVAAFAIPAAARPTAAPLLWGMALLLLVAAWLWGERARALPALAVVVGFGVAAIPVATSLASEDPPIDYRTWTLPGTDRGTTFDWEPDYGPIDWPRTGELLFRVEADRPSFWRVAVLDEFYGDGWRRSGTGGASVPAEPRPGPVDPADGGSVRTAKFSMLDIESPLLISPGTPLTVKGADGSDRDRDGTTHLEDDPLKAGASYTVTAWNPDAHPPALRAASRRYRAPLDPYTQLALPERASLESIVAPIHVDVPLWGARGGRAEARREIDATAYAQVAGLAERLTAGEHNGYDAAVAVNDYLRTTYAYDEKPPQSRLPLRAFLFQDKRGYCQQFSGAMALMLRMVGVPARVTTGFAPGTPLADGHGFEVTDLEAHSWVEVYFNGIGWIPFDPTPPTTPASLEVRGGASFGIGASEFGGGKGARGAEKARAKAAAAPLGEGDGGGGGPVSPLGLVAVLSAAVLVVPPVRSLRHRRLPPAEAAEREVAELRRVLRRTGWSRGSATLLVVEGRLRGARHQAAAGYVRRFRDRLYGAGEPPAPAPRDRRRLRRDLAAGGGLRARVRLLALIPPGAPPRLRRGRGTGRSR